MNELALCAGNGGMSLGLRLAIPAARTVCMVEREAFAAADLVQKMEAGWLDPAPVWSAVDTFDARAWRGAVDLVSAGFPCQPFSDAGKRLGTDDARWLWPQIERIVEECEPGLVWLENVPGLVRRGLGPVLSGLARLGFDAEWDLFSAAAVGAPHRRRRVFILAAHTEGRGYERGRLPARSRRNGQGATDPHRAGSDVANATGERRQQGSNQVRARQPVAPDDGEALPDALRPGLPRSPQPRHFTGPQPQSERRGWWGTEPGLGRVADGVTDRVDRLRSIGNGVVPLVVAHAFRTLASRLME